MRTGSYVLNSTKNKKERVGRILQMHANKRTEIEEVFSGDIAAAVGFNEHKLVGVFEDVVFVFQQDDSALVRCVNVSQPLGMAKRAVVFLVYDVFRLVVPNLHIKADQIDFHKVTSNFAVPTGNCGG